MNRVNEVILENGGNRKPVFYGQVPVKVIETLNYYKIWSEMICNCWWGNFLSKERSLIIYCLYWIFIVLIWQNNRASSAANWYLFNPILIISDKQYVIDRYGAHKFSLAYHIWIISCTIIYICIVFQLSIEHVVRIESQLSNFYFETIHIETPHNCLSQ